MAGAGTAVVTAAATGPAAVAFSAANSRSTASMLSPAARNTAIGVPTGIVVPGSVSSACTMPSCQHSMSIAALAVSTTATIWPFLTASPGRTCHATSLPSSMSEPSDGRRSSIIGPPPAPWPPQ